MGLRRKPTGAPGLDERRIDELIEKGGSVATAERPVDEDKRALVQLRLPQTLIDRMDRARGLRTVPPPRHAWMLEALLEKLAREEETR